MKTLSNASLVIAVICLFISAFLLLNDNISGSGPFLILFFYFLAMGIQNSLKFRGLQFTVLIFMAVTGAMYYPQWFVKIGDFELSRLIVPILMVIMFGMGTSMSVADFTRIVKMPKGVFIGLLCQFSIMPLIGMLLAKWSGFPPEIAAGIILVGCSPSGLASNVMSYIAGANLALSLTLTMVATLLAPILTPLLMRTLADQYVPIDFLAMLLSIVKIVIIPVILGLLFNHYFYGKFKWLDKAMPLISMAGIALVITIITAAGRDSLLTIGLILIAVVIIHNALGYSLGYWISRLLGMDKASSRTIAFEVGMQNSGLASGIALEMGKLATMGLAPAVFGPFMNISGSSLASYWKKSKDNTMENTY